MNTIRRFLLSVLLSAFGFFIVHDYVISDVDTDTQYELCYTQDSINTLDLPSQIHEHIHILLAVPQSAAPQTLPPHAAEPLAAASVIPASHISAIQPRPPLS